MPVAIPYTSKLVNCWDHFKCTLYLLVAVKRDTPRHAHTPIIAMALSYFKALVCMIWPSDITHLLSGWLSDRKYKKHTNAHTHTRPTPKKGVWLQLVST